VVHRVADHVDERVGDEVDHVAVEFDVFAVGVEDDLLADLPCGVADDARGFLERRLQRDHAQRHAQVLQFADDLARVRDLLDQLVPAARAHRLVLRDHRLRDDEFADHVDQAVEAVHADADGVVAAGALVAVAVAVVRGVGLRVARVVRRGGRGGRSGCGGDVRCGGGRDRRGGVRGRGGFGRRRDRRRGAWGDRGGRGGRRRDRRDFRRRRFLRGDRSRRRGPSRVGAGPVARRFRVRQGAEQFRQVVGRRGRFALQRAVHGFDQRRDGVERAETEVGVAAFEPDLLVADARQEVLGAVREVGDHGEAEHRRHALHGVEGAEDGVDRRLVRRIVLEREHRRFRALQEVLRLGDERLDHVAFGLGGDDDRAPRGVVVGFVQRRVVLRGGLRRGGRGRSGRSRGRGRLRRRRAHAAERELQELGRRVEFPFGVGLAVGRRRDAARRFREHGLQGRRIRGGEVRQPGREFPQAVAVGSGEGQEPRRHFVAGKRSPDRRAGRAVGRIVRLCHSRFDSRPVSARGARRLDAVVRERVVSEPSAASPTPPDALERRGSASEAEARHRRRGPRRATNSREMPSRRVGRDASALQSARRRPSYGCATAPLERMRDGDSHARALDAPRRASDEHPPLPAALPPAPPRRVPVAHPMPPRRFGAPRFGLRGRSSASTSRSPTRDELPRDAEPSRRTRRLGAPKRAAATLVRTRDGASRTDARRRLSNGRATATLTRGRSTRPDAHPTSIRRSPPPFPRRPPRRVPVASPSRPRRASDAPPTLWSAEVRPPRPKLGIDVEVPDARRTPARCRAVASDATPRRSKARSGDSRTDARRRLSRAGARRAPLRAPDPSAAHRPARKKRRAPRHFRGERAAPSPSVPERVRVWSGISVFRGFGRC
jgi:hypothetical protein